LDFGRLLGDLGIEGTFAGDSIRVIEVGEQGTIMDENVAFQFDAHTEGGDRGTLVFTLKGVTPKDAVRFFQVYFDLAGGTYARVSIPVQVALTDGVQHEAQESFQIVTPNATYYYHKLGAGFASMVDADGNDWISHHPSGGSAGNYRGIPNVVHPEGHFHPGNRGCKSQIVSQGPIKLKIFSRSDDHKWACTWEIYPHYATLTLLKVDHPYWFLYEGTPGGKLDEENDYCVRSTGERTPAGQSWEGDIPEPEWLYFGAGNTDRVLYLIHHEDDEQIDSYWPMEGNMTVFGFGRKGLVKYMEQVPAHFTIGFAEKGAFEVAAWAIASAYRSCGVRTGGVEVRPAGGA